MLRYCFYIQNIDEKTKRKTRSAVTCFHPYYFSTYQHHGHETYKKDVTKVVVCSLDGIQKYNTTVKVVSKEQDFILLKSEQEIFELAPPHCDLVCRGKLLLCGGFSDPFDAEKYLHKSGCITNSKTILVKGSN